MEDVNIKMLFIIIMVLMISFSLALLFNDVDYNNQVKRERE